MKSTRVKGTKGGWKLTLIEDGQEAGGGVFPVPEDDPHDGIAWWNALAEERRAPTGS